MRFLVLFACTTLFAQEWRYYGGDVAAPVFAQVVAGTLRALQVAPQAPALALAATDATTDAR